jgi:hypothetical protein
MKHFRKEREMGMAIREADISAMGTNRAESTVFQTLRSVKNLVLKPEVFFESIDSACQVKNALVFLAFAAVMHSGLTAVFEADNQLIWSGILFLNKFLFPFVMAFAIYISSAICFRGVFAFRSLFVITAFAQVPLFASWIPGAEWKIAGGVWGLYLTILGMNKLGGISKKRSAVCLGAAFVLVLGMMKCLQLASKGI